MGLKNGKADIGRFDALTTGPKNDSNNSIIGEGYCTGEIKDKGSIYYFIRSVTTP